MKSKTEIEDLLNRLQILHEENEAAKDDTLIKLYSKIAVLELCGWLEQALDELVLTYAQLQLSSEGIKTLKKDKINKISSFEYKQFRDMLIYVIGLIHVEKLEESFAVSRLQDILDKTLLMERKKHAHTTTAGVEHRTPSGEMFTYRSPSLIKGDLNTLYDLLIEVETNLNSIL